MWVKPPGESDGSSQATTPGNVPDAEGKRFDPSCDPNDPSKVTTIGTGDAGHRFGMGVQKTRVCRTDRSASEGLSRWMFQAWIPVCYECNVGRPKPS